MLGRADQAAIHLDMVALKIGLGAEFGNDLTVDGDAPIGDVLLRLAAGSDARLREDFL